MSSAADLPESDRLDGPIRRRRSLRRLMRWDGGLPGELVERLWRDPHSLLAAGRVLHHKPRATVVRLDYTTGSFVLKYLNWGNRNRRIKKSLSRSSARKSWDDSRYLLAAGIPTPRPRAYVEQRLGPFSTCSYFLTDYVPGTNLYRLMRFDRPSPELVRHLACQVARIWQQLYDLRVSHNDFKTENLLVDPGGKLWLIDMEKMRRCRGLARTRRKQARDAGDLLHPRNWRADPSAAEVFRQEILKTAAAAETLADPKCVSHPLRERAEPTNRPSQLTTVLIPCRNAADTIDQCLASVRDMADEILVADAGSMDDTLRRVREAGGCRIIERNCGDDVEFEEWARGAARHPWILRVLPEERLNPELSRQVQDLLATEPTEDGFLISRTVFFQGRRLHHGGFQDDASVRLFRKNAGRYSLRDGRVEVLVPPEKTGRITSKMLYESCPRWERRLGNMVRLARQTAHDAHRQGRPRTPLWRGPWRLVRSYFLQSGWMDGRAGLHAAWLSAFSIHLCEAMRRELDEAAESSRQASAEESHVVSGRTRGRADHREAAEASPETGFDANSARNRRRRRPAA